MHSLPHFTIEVDDLLVRRKNSPTVRRLVAYAHELVATGQPSGMSP